MAKQIRPQQVTDRLGKIIQRQQQRGYKPGWVYHQMDKKVEQNWKHLCHAYDAGQLASHALSIAKGKETLAEVEELLKDSWEIYIEDCERFGLPASER